MIKRIIKAILVTAAIPSAVFAQDNPKPTNVRNAGSFLCSDYLPVVSQQGRQVEKTAFLNWAAAYSTAASRSNGVIDMFPLGDTWELLRTVSFICSEDEAQTFEKALQTALNRMRPFWVRSDTRVTSLADPQGRTILFYAEAVRPLQEILNQYGAGLTPDGAFGNQTGNAILRLNQARGAQAWMTPDGELLYQLTRPQ
ncbi:peptidoglycan-binding protein [Pseudorhodobacter sp. E13]|uniref:peptidoglycan-binding protein n=1 Tax=Pseudorhodobacter sp. E13 TaxID=2487931 RepID=UPI000F8E4148|nr:peptidoglycan-binding protein [Pseudorhodobacter sp. E13]